MHPGSSDKELAITFLDYFSHHPVCLRHPPPAPHTSSFPLLFLFFERLRPLTHTHTHTPTHTLRAPHVYIHFVVEGEKKADRCKHYMLTAASSHYVQKDEFCCLVKGRGGSGGVGGGAVERYQRDDVQVCCCEEGASRHHCAGKLSSIFWGQLGGIRRQAEMGPEKHL